MPAVTLPFGLHNELQQELCSSAPTSASLTQLLPSPSSIDNTSTTLACVLLQTLIYHLQEPCLRGSPPVTHYG